MHKPNITWYKMSSVLHIIDPELPATSKENLSDHRPESILM